MSAETHEVRQARAVLARATLEASRHPTDSGALSSLAHAREAYASTVAAHRVRCALEGLDVSAESRRRIVDAALSA